MKNEAGELHEDITLEDVMIISKDPASLTTSNIDETAVKQIQILKDKCLDVALKDSDWRIKEFKAIFIDMFETRPVRGSSYIPTPERFSNAKCGLINIHNEDHECFKWCV